MEAVLFDIYEYRKGTAASFVFFRGICGRNVSVINTNNINFVTCSVLIEGWLRFGACRMHFN